MPAHPLHEPVLAWYAVHARALPWREPGCSPWGVLVSEVMLQQTPVVRVLPAWQQWLDRWPAPSALAADSPGEAIRLWDRLGYPRRALRLHEAATILVERHGGEVPSDVDALLALPGVGAYTAAAVASFAFGQRHPVVDTNVRRVLARTVTGDQHAAPALTSAESRLAATLVPDPAETAALWAVASMELGAVVCTARAPRCGDCPVQSLCRWRLAGSPGYSGPPRRGQAYAGTDRYIRGLLLGALRAEASRLGPVGRRPGTGAGPGPGGELSDGALPLAALVAAAPDGILRDPGQRDRCLDSLVADGLVEPVEVSAVEGCVGGPGGSRFRLPC